LITRDGINIRVRINTRIGQDEVSVCIEVGMVGIRWGVINIHIGVGGGATDGTLGSKSRIRKGGVEGGIEGVWGGIGA
jgi:hypothetical protein